MSRPSLLRSRVVASHFAASETRFVASSAVESGSRRASGRTHPVVAADRRREKKGTAAAPPTNSPRTPRAAMSKKNSKKRWNNQHQESMRREAEEAEKKAKRAAKMAEKTAEASGAMMTDGASAKIKAGRASKSSGAAAALKVSRASLKTPPTKNTRKIIKGVRVGEVQKKLKLRKGATVRGIKITNADTKNKVLAELKAEAAFRMQLD